MRRVFTVLLLCMLTSMVLASRCQVMRKKTRPFSMGCKWSPIKTGGEHRNERDGCSKAAKDSCYYVTEGNQPENCFLELYKDNYCGKPGFAIASVPCAKGTVTSVREKSHFRVVCYPYGAHHGWKREANETLGLVEGSGPEKRCDGAADSETCSGHEKRCGGTADSETCSGHKASCDGAVKGSEHKKRCDGVVEYGDEHEEDYDEVDYDEEDYDDEEED